MTRTQPKLTLAIAILMIDYLLYTTIFVVTTALIAQLFNRFSLGALEDIEMGVPEDPEMLEPPVSSDVFDSFWFLLFLYFQLIPTLLDDDRFFLDVTSFWSGFALSIWMWLYVAALLVTRGLLRSERTVNWLRWFLDVEKNPFRSIGAVATALAFIASVTIILVSAEVSRISAAA
jgi:hypothetical protein